MGGQKSFINIGKGMTLGSFSHIGIASRCTIGDYFLTGQNCLITDHTHGYDKLSESETPPEHRELKVKGPIIIGDNVFLGDNVAIIGSVKIGNNVTIGASTIVTKDIPDNSIAYGNPLVVRCKG